MQRGPNEKWPESPFYAQPIRARLCHRPSVERHDRPPLRIRGNFGTINKFSQRFPKIKIAKIPRGSKNEALYVTKFIVVIHITLTVN